VSLARALVFGRRRLGSAGLRVWIDVVAGVPVLNLGEGASGSDAAFAQSWLARIRASLVLERDDLRERWLRAREAAADYRVLVRVVADGRQLTAEDAVRARELLERHAA